MKVNFNIIAIIFTLALMVMFGVEYQGNESLITYGAFGVVSLLIATQLIPVIILAGAILKGIFSPADKKVEVKR